MVICKAGLLPPLHSKENRPNIEGQRRPWQSNAAGDPFLGPAIAISLSLAQLARLASCMDYACSSRNLLFFTVWFGCDYLEFMC